MSPLECLVLLCVVSMALASTTTWPPPPKWQEKANMARYLAHYSDYGIVSAISPEYGYIPFGTLQSFADGTMDQSTGIPYFYIANISDTYKNLAYNNSVSLSMTQAESSYCRDQGYDIEEPLCARMILYGKVVPVSGKEEAFAKKGLFTRHPAMAKWPQYHGWRFYKLQLRGVCLLDFYGGATHVPLDKYYSTQPPAWGYSRMHKLRDFENRILTELGESIHNEVDHL